MAASKINPNIWQGQETSSGYITRNRKPASAASPQWNGRVYLVGVGWHWVAGWDKRGDMISLKLEEMSDEHATKYCAPKQYGGAKPPPRQHNNGSGDGTDDIPF